MHKTGATTVVRKVTWPHKVVYTAARKPTAYQDISMPLLVQDYMIIMEGEEGAIKERMVSHLKGLMSDAEFCVGITPGHSKHLTQSAGAGQMYLA